MISTPQWAAMENKQTDGLDLLGLRLPVQYIGNILLNGITTISPTIRYLSIRSWIIHEYAQQQLPDRLSELKNFAARIEAALVIGNLLVDSSTMGMIGSTRAEELIDSPQELLPLEKLVKSAIAYSVYTNPSDQMGITVSNGNLVPTITEERGLPLVNCIKELVGDCQFFTELRQKPKISSISRESLAEFGNLLKIDRIPDTERELLIKAVIPEDLLMLEKRWELNRIATYALILELALNNRNIPSEKDLFLLATHPKPDINPLLNPILNGWLIYTIRDLLSITHEAAMKVVLDYLESLSQNHPIEEGALFAAILRDEEDISAPLKKIGLIRNDESWADLRFNELEKRLTNITNTPLEREGLCRWDNDFLGVKLSENIMSNSFDAIALLPVVWLVVEHRVIIEKVSLSQWSSMIQYKGLARLGISEVIKPAIEEWRNKNPLLPELTISLLQRSVEQHIRIAWSRLATDPRKNVSLLYRDGNMLQYLQDFQPGQSASRLKQALGWMIQLKLINEHGITTDGETILKGAYGVLNRYGFKE